MSTNRSRNTFWVLIDPFNTYRRRRYQRWLTLLCLAVGLVTTPVGNAQSDPAVESATRFEGDPSCDFSWLDDLEALRRNSSVFSVVPAFDGPVVSGRLVNFQGEPVVAELLIRTEPIRGNGGSNPRRFDQVIVPDDQGRFRYQMPFTGKLTLQAIHADPDGARSESSCQISNVDSDVQSLSLVINAPAAHEPSAMRRRHIDLQLIAPEGFPTLNGTAQVNFQRGLNRHRTVKIEGGSATIEFATYGQLDQPPISISNLSINGLILPLSAKQIQVPRDDIDEPIQIEPELAGAIYGNVRDAEGTRLPRASVRVIIADGSAQSNFEAHVDDTGHYLIYPIPFGSQVHTFASARDNTLRCEMMPEVRLSLEQAVRRQDVVLLDGVDYPLTLLDDTQQPVPGASIRVSWHHVSGVTGIAELTTDRYGRATLVGINPGIGAQFTASVSASAHHPRIRTELRLIEDEPVELIVPRGRVIRGQVLDVVSGEPIGGVNVRVNPNRAQGNFTRTQAMTDNEGWFEFTNLSVANYEVTVNDHSFEGSVRTIDDQGRSSFRFTDAPIVSAVLPDEAVSLKLLVIASSDLPVEKPEDRHDRD